MKEIDQKVIDLRTQGKSMIEISKILGVPRNNVYHYYNRGLGRVPLPIKKKSNTSIVNTTHLMSDRKMYPSYFIHITSKTINIHSRAILNEGDVVVFRNRKLRLKERLPMNRNTIKSNYYEGCGYYEFTYTTI
ncbi:IS630 transposase-related protein [Sphingobacterium sp. InxBP1]|uniref:IS630 transposase-related protein n=1 Tax=Sphingobacterium sp. InxBP1 TaxID=2870328 RepID=UPI002244B98D|nr:IS630 transposase-related protein [Sphingobacterium sp. InxBP1]MCW8311456.1 IS630 transposase-related protein [Sphingobacterium sp. InxBP1]